MKTFGVLQYTETVSDDINEAQLKQRAKVKQAEKKALKRAEKYTGDRYSWVGKRIACLYFNSGNRAEENLLCRYGPP